MGYYNLYTAICWSGLEGEGDFATWESDVFITRGFHLSSPIEPEDGQAFVNDSGCPILVEVPHVIPAWDIFVLQPSRKPVKDFATQHIAFKNITKALKWVDPDPETKHKARNILVQMIFRGAESVQHQTLDEFGIKREDIVNYESGEVTEIKGTFIHNIVFVLHNGKMINTGVGAIVNNNGVLEKCSS